MSRKGRRGFSNGKPGPLAERRSRRLSRAEQEAVVRTFFTIGTVTGTASKLGVSPNAVRRALLEAENDPMLMAARGQALDEMAGKIHAVTDQVVASITPEELVTTRREVHDRQGNLLRVVVEGPTLRDKALAIGILADKQKTLAEARRLANDRVALQANHNALMLPETIEQKQALVASMVKRLRIVDVFMNDDEVQGDIKRVMNKVHVTEADVEDAEVELASGMAPFD